MLSMILDRHHRDCRRHNREVDPFRSERAVRFMTTTVLGIVGAFIATYLGQLVGW